MRSIAIRSAWAQASASGSRARAGSNRIVKDFMTVSVLALHFRWMRISITRLIGKQLIGPPANAAQTFQFQLDEKRRALVRVAVADPFAGSKTQRPAAAFVLQTAEQLQCLIFFERIRYPADKIQISGQRITQAQIGLINPVTPEPIAKGKLTAARSTPAQTQPGDLRFIAFVIPLQTRIENDLPGRRPVDLGNRSRAAALRGRVVSQLHPLIGKIEDPPNAGFQAAGPVICLKQTRCQHSRELIGVGKPVRTAETIVMKE